MRIPDTKFHFSKTLCNTCQCIHHVILHSLLLLDFLNLLHLLCNLHENENGWDVCNNDNSENNKDRCGHFKNNKVFRQIKRFCTNCHYNVCYTHGLAPITYLRSLSPAARSPALPSVAQHSYSVRTTAVTEVTVFVEKMENKFKGRAVTKKICKKNNYSEQTEW